eukprot:gene6498-8933_t
MTTRITTTVTSSSNAVTGSHRFKYFKRPIMPRVNALAPGILLAPSNDTNNPNNPLVPVELPTEALVKDAEVQTMYRESEAQTNPYTPDFIVSSASVQEPEVLLLKNLTYENGLPLSKREISMIEYARSKKVMESNLPPFTDEASLTLRKRLMEEQEMKEFKLREGEIDQRREDKLQILEQALHDREESNEFLSSQKLEGIRLARMEEREKVLQKIRHKRIKALRLLAHQRNLTDPVLSDGVSRDIINDYFDRGSTVYAPVKREGIAGGGAVGAKNASFDVNPRTLPLDNINNIMNLEYSMPRCLVDSSENVGNPTALMSKTAPVGKGGSSAAEPRMTSAAQRHVRSTKKDVEIMHHILHQKKQQGKTGINNGLNNTTGSDVADGNTKGRSQLLTAMLSKKPKGRPPTPDFSRDRIHPIDDNPYNPYPNSINDDEFQTAIMLLQRLIRGRAVQNIMFEGKYRRRELIHELRQADQVLETLRENADSDPLDRLNQEYMEREAMLKESTTDTVIGTVASNILFNLSTEKERIDLLDEFQMIANKAIAERLKVETIESGRRDREDMKYPKISSNP